MKISSGPLFALLALAMAGFAQAQDDGDVTVIAEFATNAALNVVEAEFKTLGEEVSGAVLCVLKGGSVDECAPDGVDRRRLQGSPIPPVAEVGCTVTSMNVEVVQGAQIDCPDEPEFANYVSCVESELHVKFGASGCSSTYIQQAASFQVWAFLAWAPISNQIHDNDITLVDVNVKVTSAKNPGVFDDPHFKTWSGHFYDFMGECDLKLLAAPAFDTERNMGLDIDIRTKIRYDYSYVESAVIKLNDTETLEVSSYGEYSHNGVYGAELRKIAGYPIIHSTPTEKIHLFEIKISENEVIKLKTFKDMVSVIISETDSTRFEGSTGMMGDFETGKMLARDGNTEITDPNYFAAEWQIREDEPMNFAQVRAPQHPKECLLPSPTARNTLRRRLGESISRSAAEEACAKWTENKEACVHDVMATGDVDIASAIAF